MTEGLLLRGPSVEFAFKSATSPFRDFESGVARYSSPRLRPLLRRFLDLFSRPLRRVPRRLCPCPSFTTSRSPRGCGQRTPMEWFLVLESRGRCLYTASVLGLQSPGLRSSDEGTLRPTRADKARRQERTPTVDEGHRSAPEVRPQTETGLEGRNIPVVSDYGSTIGPVTISGIKVCSSVSVHDPHF